LAVIGLVLIWAVCGCWRRTIRTADDIRWGQFCSSVQCSVELLDSYCSGGQGAVEPRWRRL